MIKCTGKGASCARTRRPPVRYRAHALGITAALALVVSAAPTVASRPLEADTPSIMLPLVTESVVDRGRSEVHGSEGAYALTVRVEPPDDVDGWTLFLRAEHPVFSPLGEGKPSSDVRWKLDWEDASAYRPLESHDQLVLSSANHGAEAVPIDLAVDVDWCTSPGRYTAGLVFTLAYE